MTDLNHVIMIGRLTRDAETPTERGPVHLALAVNRRVKRGDEYVDEASFFDCEYWHRSIVPYLTKGKQIAVTGELRQERWNDRESGAVRSKIVVVINDRDGIQLLGGGQNGPPSDANASGARNHGEDAEGPKAVPLSRQVAVDEGFTDDIPF